MGFFGVLGVGSNKKKVGGDSCAGIAADTVRVAFRCKPNSVYPEPVEGFVPGSGRALRQAQGRRPFLWDSDYSEPQATYPQGFCRPGTRAPCIFGLAAGGVCRAIVVTNDAVRSYRTISPLPNPRQS